MVVLAGGVGLMASALIRITDDTATLRREATVLKQEIVELKKEIVGLRATNEAQLDHIIRLDALLREERKAPEPTARLCAGPLCITVPAP